MKPVAATSPIISEVIPGQGPSTGGTRVAILGSNFAETPALRVRFDNTDVIPEFHGPGTLVCHTPQHSPGPVLVRVANGPHAWSEGACTYTYGVVTRSAGNPATHAVPAMFGAQLGINTTTTTTTTTSSPHMHGFGFAMDISGISVGMADAIDAVGYAALHYAAACGSTDQTRALLAIGAHVYIQDRMGNTPIHWAVAFNQVQVSLYVFIPLITSLHIIFVEWL